MVTASIAIPSHAATWYPAARGSARPAGVSAASTTPLSALPAENPIVRSTWLKLIALPVSCGGTARTMYPGTAANTQPTPNPATPISTKMSTRWPRATANPSVASSTTAQLNGSTGTAGSRLASAGTTRLATKPSSENGTSTSPATTTDAPNPYPAA